MYALNFFDSTERLGKGLKTVAEAYSMSSVVVIRLILRIVKTAYLHL